MNGDKTIVLPTAASGQKIVAALSPVTAGDKVVLFPTATGRTIVAAVSPVSAGDKVIVATTASGQRIVVKTGGTGDTEAVDPCTSLTLAMDPADPTRILVSWTPGANNTGVRYEYATGDYPDTINSGDIHRTIAGVTTLSRSEPVLMYYVWHYVCIWGMKGTRYSSTYLEAAIVAEPTAILEKFKMYVSMVADTTPKTAGNSFNEYTASAGSSLVVGQFSFNWSGQGTVKMSNIAAGVNTLTAYMDDRVIFTQLTGRQSGETVDTGSGNNWGYKTLDVTSICNVGANLISIEVQDNHGGAWGWGAENGGVNVKQIYFVCTDPNAITDSWFIEGDDEEPPEEEHSSGVYVRNPWNGGDPTAEVTLYFYDGFTSNNVGTLSYKVVDRDNGVLHIWASVPEGGRPKEIWAGDTLLCTNIYGDGELIYDGYLTISEL